MKKKTLNKIALSLSLGLGVILLASCTANFCTVKDKAHIMYSYDVGSTVYVENESQIPDDKKATKEKLNDYVWCYQDFEKDYKGEPAKMITDINKAAKSNMMFVPTNKYWFKLDRKALEFSWTSYAKDILKDESKTLKDARVEQIKDCLNKKGYLKFYDETKEKEEDRFWGNVQKWNKELANDPEIGLENCPNSDFSTLYYSTMTSKVNNVRSCITINGGIYGNYGYNHNKVEIEKKTWGYAWSRGFLEGLLIYPVSYLVEFFSNSFGMGGFGQLGSILLVTFIVRGFLFLVSFKSTLGQQKMQMLQPELAKIQAKYPNANNNQMQKQRMSQEQMALYKKNKIHPFGSLLVLIVQFPLFIAVWGAMQGSASLASDAVWNLHLSESIWNTLTNTSGLPGNVNGWWTAFALFILMAVAQFVSMKLPQWIQKYREKKLPKYATNVPQSKSQRQMKWFGYIMLVMIIIMGFTLPAGMGVYWLAGALFSIVQTIITQLIISAQNKKRKENR